MQDRFRHHADSPMGPATRAFAITPSDSDELPMATKAIYVGATGDIAVRPLDGTQDVVFANVPAGGILDLRASAVRATGTSASALVGLA